LQALFVQGFARPAQGVDNGVEQPVGDRAIDARSNRALRPGRRRPRRPLALVGHRLGVGQLLDQAKLQVLEAFAPDRAAEPQDRGLTDAQVGRDGPHARAHELVGRLQDQLGDLQIRPRHRLHHRLETRKDVAAVIGVSRLIHRRSPTSRRAPDDRYRQR
jgi:hypothetical protein